MSAISSIVKRRVSSAFWIEPADTATPTIAGAIAGSGTSKITSAPGPLLALPYIATSLPPAAASTCSTAARRSVLGFSLIAFRACGVYSAVKQNSIGLPSLFIGLLVLADRLKDVSSQKRSPIERWSIPALSFGITATSVARASRGGKTMPGEDWWLGSDEVTQQMSYPIQ